MAFVKRDVKDRVVQYPRRYQMVEVQPGIFDLIPMPGTITEPGTAINKAYLQPIEEAIEDIEDGTTVVQNAYSANNAIISQRAAKLDTARKINGVNFDGTQDITIADATKAPTKHDSTSTGYGVGTASSYGHVMVRNDLNGTETSGATVSPAKIKEINDLVNSNAKYTLVRTLSMTASGTGDIQSVAIPASDFVGHDEFLFVLRGSIRATVSSGSTWVTVAIYLGASSNASSGLSLWSDRASDTTPLPTTNVETNYYALRTQPNSISSIIAEKSQRMDISTPYFIMSKGSKLTAFGTVYLDIYRRKNR